MLVFMFYNSFYVLLMSNDVLLCLFRYCNHASDVIV